MTKKIIKRRAKPDDSISYGLHPLLQRIYAARGIQSEKELERGLEFLLPYHSLLNIQAAVELLAYAVIEQKNILIVGDFDADGATSSALSVRALKSFGANAPHYLVPNRFEFGYGLTPELVDVAKQFNPYLIVTVDNGIANHAGVVAAKEAGIKVLITDHHLPAETLPPADAIVNPNQAGDVFQSKHMAGVGVIFYVMLALRRYLSEQQWFLKKNIPEPNMARLLDLVALGTIADVVSLDHNNRILVHQGLQRIRLGQCVAGIIALCEISKKNPAKITAADLGFSIAPRLNAAGRLDDMSLGIECLLSDDLASARQMADTLNQLNDERRVIEQDMQEQALHALKKIKTDKEDHGYGICLFDETWHQGVIGIIASRIKDRLHRPVIAFAVSNETELKGSARSIAGLHIRDVLAEINVQYPNLIHKFGGHAMAAGLTLLRASLHDFMRVFNDIVAEKLKSIDLQQVLLSDGELHPEELSLEVADILQAAGPFGQAFPEPLFDGIFQLLEQRLVGGRHLKMTLGKDKHLIPAIAFNIDLNQWPNYRCDAINIAYRIDINEFRGKRSVQLIVEHMETA